MAILIPITILLFIALFLIYREVQNDKLLRTVTHKNRGTWSERDLVLQLLKNGFTAENLFHDLYVSKSDGSFSQIDLIILTNVGVIVVEVKHLSGWIFGTGTQSKWIQVLAYGKEKYSFYNPIFQNNSHIITLKNRLSDLDDIPLYSLIIFYGDCVLKRLSQIPNDVTIVKSSYAIDAIREIINNGSESAYNHHETIKEILTESVNNGQDSNIRLQHIENIQAKWN
ncbi:MAG: NERD domain-containing protein [Hydrotalea sp.]|nr:NERD domain-containing protein [Hydrotalea sp.]